MKIPAFSFMFFTTVNPELDQKCFCWRHRVNQILTSVIYGIIYLIIVVIIQELLLFSKISEVISEKLEIILKINELTHAETTYVTLLWHCGHKFCLTTCCWWLLYSFVLTRLIFVVNCGKISSGNKFELLLIKNSEQSSFLK